MAALAHDFIRPLIEEQCAAVREAAGRVARSGGDAPAGDAQAGDAQAGDAQAGDAQADTEAIHDYRVALRRLRTVLGASRALFKRTALQRVKDGLRQFARTAGAVRDEEVLAETIGALNLPPATRDRVDAWLHTRARKERALRARVIAELARPEDADPESVPEPTPEERAADAQAAQVEAAVSLVPEPASLPAPAEAPAPALSAILDLAEALPLRRRAASVSTRALAMDALADAAERTLRDAAQPAAGTPDQMHALRIRWKGVRYAGELFSAAVARTGALAAQLDERVKVATRMQKRLGELHDLDEAIARVARARMLTPGDRMVVHHGLRTARAALAARLEKELPAALSLLERRTG